MCREGQAVVRGIFEKANASDLRGFIVWLPMLPGDSLKAAATQSQAFQDRRVLQGWNGERRVGDLFAEILKLTRTAWDVYLLYPPNVTWKEKRPPPPSFWMHQLPPDWGADQKLLLDPGRLSHEVHRLLRGDG
jgi:hypothetical protein